ncbi:MAG: hypothetical protein KAI81_07355, partial [Candidatus Marinimicrobia bacterium]|nr:hypothetical protein [Candidatus Neomarinimicrobiota bacterium]
DMTLNLDTEIDIPLYLELKIKAENEDGDSVVLVINDRLTPGVGFNIEGAEELINIFPNKITAEGRAIADGYGSMSASDVVVGTMLINVPLVFNLTEAITLDLAFLENDSTALPDSIVSIENAILHADIFSDFQFEVLVDVFIAKDSMAFVEDSTYTGPVIAFDTLATLIIPEAGLIKDQLIVMDEKIFDYLDSTFFIKPQIVLNSSLEKSEVHSTDSLFIKLYGTIEALIDIDGEDEEGED